MDSMIKILLWFYVLGGLIAGLNWWLKFAEVSHETMMRHIEVGMLAWAILEINRKEK